jgi:drug/metabolite transporter (DMT)-like permease
MNPAGAIMKNKYKSITAMIFSSFSFSAMQIIVKLLDKIPLMEKVFFRNFISLILSFAMIRMKKLSFFGQKENRKYLFFRSLYGYLGIVLFFYATSKMFAADAAMLNKLSPVFVSLLAYLLLKEKISRLQMTSLFISLTGAMLVIKPHFSFSMLPAAAGILSALVSAAAYICITFIGKNESIYTVVFYFSTLSSIFCIPFMIANFALPGIKELALLLLLGALACAGQISLTYAYNGSPASEISIYDYTNIIFSSILGFLFLNEVPDKLSIAGGILIIASSLILFIYGKKQN